MKKVIWVIMVAILLIAFVAIPANAAPNPPTSTAIQLTTGHVRGITQTSAEFYGKLTSLGIHRYAIVYFEYWVDGGLAKISFDAYMFAPGDYGVLVRDLTPQTRYNVRATGYGSSGGYYAYGKTITFKTKN